MSGLKKLGRRILTYNLNKRIIFGNIRNSFKDNNRLRVSNKGMIIGRDMSQQYKTRRVGTLYTKEYSVYLGKKKDTFSQKSCVWFCLWKLKTFFFLAFFFDKKEDQDGNLRSYFHDVPLYANKEEGILNAVIEIPRWTNGKLEISKDRLMNPIIQDVSKGNVRFVNNIYPFKGYMWNVKYCFFY